MKVLISKSKDFYFLLITSFLFFLLRLPSLFEPYWYGDEGIYQVLGLAIRQGQLLYRDIWDNKPPLLYLLYALFNSDQFTIRVVSLIFGLLAVFVFFLLAKNLFKSSSSGEKITYLTTGFFAFIFATPLIEGNIANAENFMLLPILLAAFLIYYTKGSALFSAGLLLGFAFLTKIVAIFDLGAFLIFLLIISVSETLVNWNSFSQFLLKMFAVILGFVLPLILTVLFFISTNSFYDFLSATFFQMFGYVGYGNQLIIPQGFLILKLFLLFGFCLFVFLKRGSFEKSVIFILIWFAFSVFNALFSQRPYPHYLLVLLPSFSLLLGLIFFNPKYQKVMLATTIIIVLFINTTFSLYKKTILYYQNFILFLTNNRSLVGYQSFFDKQTPIDYKLVQFLKTRTQKNDNIFIWGNNAQVYKMLNKLPPLKYTVAYHMTSNKNSLNETTLAIAKAKPKFIVAMPNQSNIPFKLINYSLKYKLDNVLVYERNF